MGKYRELSPMECSYLASDSAHKSPYVNQFIVAGKGGLKLDLLQKAVQRAADANPGIKLKLKGLWGYRYWDNQGFYPKVSEQITQLTALKDIASAFDGSPINCRQSPCAEVILIKVKSLQAIHANNTYLVFRIHHAICDGAACLHWIQEVFRALNQEPLLRSSGRLCEWDVARSYNVQKYGLGPYDDWLPVKEVQPELALFQFHWQCFSIKQSVHKPLAKLAYLFAQEAWATNRGGHVCLRIPSDLRRLLDDKDTHLGNLTGAIDIEVNVDDASDDIYQTLLKAKRKNLDLSVFPEHLWLAKWLPRQFFTPKPSYFKTRYANGHCNITAILSQLGKIDLQSLSSDSFQARHLFAIPIPIEGVSLSCGILQNKHGLDICLSAPKSLMSTSQMEGLIDKIKGALEETPPSQSNEFSKPLLQAN